MSRGWCRVPCSSPATSSSGARIPACEHHDPRLVRAGGPLVLMCAQGYQSSLAAATLQEIGIRSATDMIGGFEAWAAAGLTVLAPARR